MTATATRSPTFRLPVFDPRRPDTPTAVCPYCGVGCVLRGHVEDDRLTRVTADREALPNLGMMCPKGATLAGAFGGDRRILYPMLRRSKDQPLARVTWDEAIGFITERLSVIRAEQGPDAIAWYGSGQLDTEASYVFTKLFKGFLGANHTDTNSRLCMSSAAAGYQASLGSDGPPPCYDDIAAADLFLLIGANIASNHPVLLNMVRKRRSAGENVRVVVVDPRRTKTAELADLHVPVRPGGDVALLELVARRMLDRGATDTAFIEKHTSGGGPFIAHLRSLDAAALLETAGVSADTIDTLADLIAARPNLISFYCMGVNQSTHGVDKNTAIINLHLLLGAIGRPGAGPFSLTGQPNAMGGREVGYMSHQLPGYRFVADAGHRAEVERAWGLEPGSISPRPGYHAVEMFKAAAAGRIGAMWIACTNPAVTIPDASVAQAGLRNTGLVIVQDISHDSETAAFADVLLPAAQWGEKSGTMTNSERLVARSHRFLDPPGESVPDWYPPAAVGRAMGFDGFEFTRAHEIWDEYRLLTAGRPCDLSGMTNDRLDAGPLRWPCPSEDHPGTPRLYTDGVFATPDGRARFVIGDAAGPDEAPDRDYPWLLTTGRTAAHWHTRTRTALVPKLNAREPDPFIEVHTDDAGRLGIIDGQRIVLVSRRGRVAAPARLTTGIRPGVLFMPFHWGESYDGLSNVNKVTNPAHDAVSKQPELKACAVRIEMGTEGETVST